MTSTQSLMAPYDIGSAIDAHYEADRVNLVTKQIS